MGVMNAQLSSVKMHGINNVEILNKVVQELAALNFILDVSSSNLG